METEQAPDPNFNYDYYIYKDTWQNVLYVRHTRLMQLAEGAKKYIQEELHRNTISDFVKRIERSSTPQLARTWHAQMTSIFTKSLPEMLEAKAKDRKTKDGELEEFEKSMLYALQEAKQIDKECTRRAEEERRLSRAGNIKFITVPRKAPPRVS